MSIFLFSQLLCQYDSIFQVQDAQEKMNSLAHIYLLKQLSFRSHRHYVLCRDKTNMLFQYFSLFFSYSFYVYHFYNSTIISTSINNIARYFSHSQPINYFDKLKHLTIKNSRLYNKFPFLF